MAVFAPSGPAPLSTISLQGAQVPTIVNITCTLANTEYTYALPPLTKYFSIGPRNVSKVNLAFVAAETSTNYLTIGAGEVRTYGALSLSLGLDIYFSSSKAGEVIEIISWA